MVSRPRREHFFDFDWVNKISWNSILIAFFPSLVFWSGLVPSSFLTKILYAFLIISQVCLPSVTLTVLIILWRICSIRELYAAEAAVAEWYTHATLNHGAMQPVSRKRFGTHVPTSNNIGSCVFYVVCATQQYRAKFSMWFAPPKRTVLCFLCALRAERLQDSLYFSTQWVVGRTSPREDHSWRRIRSWLVKS